MRTVQARNGAGVSPDSQRIQPAGPYGAESGTRPVRSQDDVGGAMHLSEC
jgi:hypothetical protein